MDAVETSPLPFPKQQKRSVSLNVDVFVKPVPRTIFFSRSYTDGLKLRMLFGKLEGRRIERSDTSKICVNEFFHGFQS